VQPRQHASAVADAAIHKRHVLDGIERRHIGVACNVPISLSTGNSPIPLHQLVAGLPVGDEAQRW